MPIERIGWIVGTLLRGLDRGKIVATFNSGQMELESYYQHLILTDGYWEHVLRQKLETLERRWQKTLPSAASAEH